MFIKEYPKGNRPYTTSFKMIIAIPTLIFKGKKMRFSKDDESTENGGEILNHINDIVLRILRHKSIDALKFTE